MREAKRYYVVRFLDGGYDAISDGPFVKRTSASVVASRRRAGVREYNRIYPLHKIIFHVESNESLPFDPKTSR